ncbi:28S ribosomal protein S14, mitochondrial isoform X1 [Sturnira hondurensis]|uniref:28S ribosomal protein S14, mitochondrial isoform X1 n=1 Tax=Sturnira hondurensis TaxID=192404 RepID=UPI00187931F6|nr:28S ribosomal protein S14, mitochondrial isoform X1 [Sturnira hondurensis]
MAASMLGSLLRGVRQMVPSSASGQVRGYYVDWRMLRDVKRRKMAFDYADERLRINSLRKNTILPKILQHIEEERTVPHFMREALLPRHQSQEVADEEIAALPRDSCPVRIRNRCVMTSRPRGVKRRWRLSRIVFRHLADHGQMSGVQRAIW